ncbi:hypothetical protein ACLOJK_020610 [Asimina triloba]
MGGGRYVSFLEEEVSELEGERSCIGSVFNWYFLSKTLAEKAALQYGEKSGLHVVNSTVNATSLFLLQTLRGEQETVENRGLVIADVRDVADALIIAYEKPEA